MCRLRAALLPETHGERDDPRPDRRREEDVHEDEPPRKLVSPLRLADHHLDEESGQHRQGEGTLEAKRRPPAQERGGEDDVPDAEDGGRPHVHLHRALEVPDPLDRLAARVRPRRRRERAGDDEGEPDGDEGERKPPKPRGERTGQVRTGERVSGEGDDDGEGLPSAVELIAGGEIDLVVNTPRGRGPRADGAYIRRAANTHKVPCLTTAAAALAAAGGIADWARYGLVVKSLQEYYEGGQLRLEV